MNGLEQLDLYLNEHFVGVVTDGGAGFASLAYDAGFVGVHGEGAVVISIGLPVRSAAYPGVETRPFFDGLLPEGDTRRVVSERLRLDQADVFGLLRELGRDVAGALVFVPAGSAYEPGLGTVRWLSEDELTREIDALPYAPLGIDAEGAVRLSLAGVQPKLGLVRDAKGRFGLPIDGHPTTHILKPVSTARDRSGALLFPTLAQNEAYCMRVAAHSGLSVAAVDMIELRDAGPCVVVERYDRHVSADGVVTRLHQEDACQALRIPPARKYEERGGPSLAQIAGLISDFGSRPIPDRLELLDGQVLHVLVGNTDAHGKNVSFLYTADGIRLAPLYDVVSTLVYSHHPRDLAVAIGGERFVEDVDLAAFERAYEQCGLTADLAKRRVGEVVDRIEAAAETADTEAHQEGWHVGLIDAIHERIARTARQVRAAS